MMKTILFACAILASSIALVASLGAFAGTACHQDPAPSAAERRGGTGPIVPMCTDAGTVLTCNGSSSPWGWQSTAPGVQYGAYSTRPTAGTAGRLFVPSDGPIPYVDTGSTWLPFINGVAPGIGEVAPSNVSPFIHYYGTGSGFGNDATQTAQGGALALATTTAPSGFVYNFQLFDQTYTPGASITVWFDAWMWTYSRVGLYLANGMPTATSDGGTNAMQMITFGFVNNTELENADFIWSGTAWSTGSFSPGTVTSALRVPGPVGLRIVESAGPDYTFEYSLDNVHWNIVNGPFSVAAYIGAPGHCGFFIDAESNGAQPAAKLLAWANQ